MLVNSQHVAEYGCVFINALTTSTNRQGSLVWPLFIGLETQFYTSLHNIASSWWLTDTTLLHTHRVWGTPESYITTGKCDCSATGHFVAGFATEEETCVSELFMSSLLNAKSCLGTQRNERSIPTIVINNKKLTWKTHTQRMWMASLEAALWMLFAFLSEISREKLILGRNL